MEVIACVIIMEFTSPVAF